VDATVKRGGTDVKKVIGITFIFRKLTNTFTGNTSH
jgi:hypothetical protein